MANFMHFCELELTLPETSQITTMVIIDTSQCIWIRCPWSRESNIFGGWVRGCEGGKKRVGRGGGIEDLILNLVVCKVRTPN